MKKQEVLEAMASAYFEVTTGSWSYCPVRAKQIRRENMEFALNAFLLKMGVSFEELKEILHRGKDDGK